MVRWSSSAYICLFSSSARLCLSFDRIYPSTLGMTGAVSVLTGNPSLRGAAIPPPEMTIYRLLTPHLMLTATHPHMP